MGDIKSCKLSLPWKVGFIRNSGLRNYPTVKMASKVILLFLLITGVLAVSADFEFDQDLLESEDYDTVEEDYEDVDVEARGMEDDIALLDSESKAEMHNFCSQEEHADDIVCQAMGVRKY